MNVPKPARIEFDKIIDVISHHALVHATPTCFGHLSTVALGTCLLLPWTKAYWFYEAHFTLTKRFCIDSPCLLTSYAWVVIWVDVVDDEYTHLHRQLQVVRVTQPTSAADIHKQRCAQPIRSFMLFQLITLNSYRFVLAIICCNVDSATAGCSTAVAWQHLFSVEPETSYSSVAVLFTIWCTQRKAGSVCLTG